MAFKMNGFPTHKGTTIAKQTYTTPEMNKERNDAEIELNTSKASGTSTKGQQDRYDKAAAGFIQKNTEDNDRRKAEGKSVFPQKVVKEGEGQDQNKIFDEKGNHVGNWVNGKKVMLKPTIPTTPAKNKEEKVKVTTTYNADGSYVKSDGKKSTTYTLNPKYMPKSNRTGNYKYITGGKNADGSPIGE